MATYNLFLDGTNRIHITGGNTKIGRGVFNISLLPSDEPLQKKDGKVLTNIKGTCGGCCDGCKNHCYAVKQAYIIIIQLSRRGAIIQSLPVRICPNFSTNLKPFLAKTL